jgi:hypothetical protein
VPPFNLICVLTCPLSWLSVQAGSEALPAEIGWLPPAHSKQQQQQQQGGGESIKQHQVICNSDLALKEVIGSGAEGKVRIRLMAVVTEFVTMHVT